MDDAHVAWLKSVTLFDHGKHDVALYNRANYLVLYATRTENHAEIEFRKALKAEWHNRFHIDWKDDKTCTVWVRAKYSKDGHDLHFNKSLRCRKCLT